MNAKIWIEIFGYIGSLLVLISFLMTSVFKLRVVNTIGSLIFMTYALIIKSYPTAIMNFCLVLINLHFLWKMRKVDNQYELIETNRDDQYLNYLLKYYKDDIEKCFPGISLDFTDANRFYLISNEGKPVGLTIGKASDQELELLLDYSIPAYRDFSIGSFLFPNLQRAGYKKITYKGSTANHEAYLTNMGFKQEDGTYVKEF